MAPVERGLEPRTAMRPPGQIPRAMPMPHPRRPPAHRSVSLMHGPRANSSPPQDRSDSSSDSQLLGQKRAADGKSSDSPSSLAPFAQHSSGESSNADRWFEKSNNDVRDHSTSFGDNDPPFFMRNSSSSNTPPDAQQPGRPLGPVPGGTNSLPLRIGVLPTGTDGSSNEDFRSVIDDLTVENKKLRRRLKKYEKLHDAHLRDEKLFEVRIHGLPPEKKRELEETLRKFTASLGPTGFHPNGYEGLLPTLNSQHSHHKGGSSQTSLQNDSAYASLSASGQGSSGQSGNDTTYRPRFPTAAARRQNIHSYLHHIPEALLLHPNPVTMSERQKKKMAVRRLEQIFAGTRAVAGPHQHPMQQQEISHMAARETRLAVEASGQRAGEEGLREALIMQSEVDPTTKHDGDTPSRDDEMRDPMHKSGPTNSGVHSDQSDEQRPTRPLDVDPHRAQVPADNMRYIRHLGFSPPDIESDRPAQSDHGWIYLNLLINMAQLHTINVTADFVRKALAETRSNLELSHDGRKVRWRGGPSLKAGSSSGGSSTHRLDMDTPDGQSPRKRPRLSTRESSRRQMSTAQGGNTSIKGPGSNKLVYTPLFFHKSSSESDSSEEEAEEDDSMTSPYRVAPAGDSSGMTSSGMRTTASKRPKRRDDDGPIIFYNNARFCTDLSGDRRPMGNINAPPYTSISSQPIGKQYSQPDDLFEPRGPLADVVDLPDCMNLSDNPIPESMELSFPPPALLGPSAAPVSPSMGMEACGIGGVWPTDHFAVTVKSRVTQVDEVAGQPARGRHSRCHSPPAKFQPIFRDIPSARPIYEQELLSVRKEDLRPSDLPPALGYMSGHGSREDGDSDSEADAMSVSPESPLEFPPSAAPQPVDLHYDMSGDESDDESDDDGESGSLDLLATAREVDPEAIRRREREYDANMAERLAEEIPAGSSAATAGGGSGFASPASGMTREEYQRALKEVRDRAEAFTRARTTDSMVVQGAQDSSEEEDSEAGEVSDIAS